MVPKALIISFLCMAILEVESVRLKKNKKRRAIDRQRAGFTRTNITSNQSDGHRCNAKVTGSSGYKGFMGGLDSDFPWCHCKGQTDVVMCNSRIVVPATCPCACTKPEDYPLCQCGKNGTKPKFNVWRLDNDEHKTFCGGMKPVCTPAGEVKEDPEAAVLGPLMQMNTNFGGRKKLLGEEDSAARRYIISLTWLSRFMPNSDPGPIDNEAIFEAAVAAPENLDAKHREEDISDKFPQLDLTLHAKRKKLAYKLIAEKNWNILKEKYGVKENSELLLNEKACKRMRTKVDYSAYVDLLEEVDVIFKARQQGENQRALQGGFHAAQPTAQQNPFGFRLQARSWTDPKEKWGKAAKRQWFKKNGDGRVSYQVWVEKHDRKNGGFKRVQANPGDKELKWNNGRDKVTFDFLDPVHVSSFDSATNSWRCDKPYKLNRRGTEMVEEYYQGGTPGSWQVDIPVDDLTRYFEPVEPAEQQQLSNKWALYQDSSY